MNKVIIALDYNATAQKVAKEGYLVAKALGAEVTIAHVFTEPAYYALEYSPIMGYHGTYTEGVVSVVEDIKKEAENFLAVMARNLGDDSVKTALLKGETVEAILQFGEAIGASLIVTGSHRHHGLERLFVTNMAAQLVKHSKLPLLIIPNTGS